MKILKEHRNLLIAMAIGDGTINKNGYLAMRHCSAQKEYLEWKVGLLKPYISKRNIYHVDNGGHGSFEARTLSNDFCRLLRRIIYKPNKMFSKKLLNRIGDIGVAIWYMDDGNLSVRRKNGVVSSFEIYINTCVSKDENQLYIDWFWESYGIKFNHNYNNGKYRLRCSTKEGAKFLKIVSPFVENVECMKYKINIY